MEGLTILGERNKKECRSLRGFNRRSSQGER